MGRVTLQVTITNPTDPIRTIVVDADIDPREPIAVVPRWLAQQLALEPLGDTAPGSAVHSYAFIQRDENVTVTSVTISEQADRVVLGQSTLTGLLLEVDRQTGELREFKPLLL